MNIPVNRWTVGLGLIVTAWLGGDLWSSLLQVIALMTSAHVPAL